MDGNANASDRKPARAREGDWLHQHRTLSGHAVKVAWWAYARANPDGTFGREGTLGFSASFVGEQVGMSRTTAQRAIGELVDSRDLRVIGKVKVGRQRVNVYTLAGSLMRLLESVVMKDADAAHGRAASTADAAQNEVPRGPRAGTSLGSCFTGTNKNNNSGRGDSASLERQERAEGYGDGGAVPSAGAGPLMAGTHVELNVATSVRNPHGWTLTFPDGRKALCRREVVVGNAYIFGIGDPVGRTGVLPVVEVEHDLAEEAPFRAANPNITDSELRQEVAWAKKNRARLEEAFRFTRSCGLDADVDMAMVKDMSFPDARDALDALASTKYPDIGSAASLLTDLLYQVWMWAESQPKLEAAAATGGD